MKYLILFSCLLGTFLQAQMLYITDKSGYEILVENPRIYYTSKKGSSLSLFYVPDVEKKGIRIKQGMGTTVIAWRNIDTLQIGELKDNNTISVTLTDNNISSSLLIENPVGGLEAESSLGTFSIDFKDIKRISTSKTTNETSTLPVNSAHIQWDENLSVTLDSTGLRGSNGIRVFGSFNLKGEDFRSISFRAKEIKFPKHNIILARKDYTIYILDLEKEEKIGQFKIPSSGTPRTLEIQRDNYCFTMLRSTFRMLSKKGNKVSKPGPKITQTMVYRNGKYIHERKGN